MGKNTNPLASSLALALGMSVAVATDPTFQYGTSGISNSDTIQSGQDIAVSDITWQTNNGLLNPKATSTSTIIEMINIVFDGTTNSGSSSISDSTLTITGGGKITSSNQPVIQLSSSQGIQIGSTGKGEIKVDFASAAYTGSSGNNARSAIIDLSQVSSGVALKGNIFIGTGTADTIPLRNIQNRFVAKFGGNGMEGDITIKRTGDGDGLVSVFYLNGASADIDGKITLQAGMAIKNNIIYDNGNKNLKASMDLMQGVLTYGFTGTVNASDRIFTLDTSSIGEGIDSRSRIDISGGHLVFDDVKQVVFKNGSADGGTFTISPKKVGSDTYEDGSVKFLFNSSAEANVNNPIVKGNISATNGSVIFALKDTSSVTGANPFDSVTTNDTPPTKVYYIDGNLSTNNGGLSSFWDDTKGFYGKIATTSGHQISQTGGLIGRNDAWFSGSQNISSIQATTNGTSHLVFDQTTTIFGNTSKTETTAIRSTDGNSAMLLFRSGASISGDIRTKGDSSNIVVFEGDASIQNGAIKIENSGLGLQRKTNNVLMFNGLNNNIALNSLSILGDWYTDNSEERQFNILSFNNPSTVMTTTIGVANTTYGTNFIGKNIITTNGYNAKLFDTTDAFYPTLKTDNTAVEEFLKDDHQVRGTFTFGNGKGDAISGSNYINVENAIINGGISTTSMTVIKIKNTVAVQGAVSQSESGTNNIYFDGKNSSINGGVIATGNRSGVGGNNISFKDGGTITGDISVSSDGVSIAWAGYNGNNITFNGLSNASIIGNLSASDGQDGNKGNIIKFNGSGINKIEGNITNSGAGRTDITFAQSSHTATIKGNISVSGGSSTISATQASLQITGNISQNGGQNTITLGGSNSSITGNIESRSNYGGKNENTITFSNGGSIIGDISVFGTSISTSWAGYNSNNITFNGADYNASIIGNLYAEEGYADKGNVITFNGNRTNKIEGNITTVNGGRTSITFAGTSSLLVTGDITTSGNGKNLFTLTANNSTLILQGENNSITTLTAIATADSENTLTLDATNNDSVFATIGTLANGGNLNVDFRGINGTKTTQLTLDTTNATSLKSVSVASGLNNTLALTGTATMTIAEAVTIGETSGTAPKGVIFDLTSGADLTFAKGLTTNTKGVTTFKLGAENVITISSGNFTNNGIHNFDLNSSSKTTTFKYGSGLAFSSGENNINFNVDGMGLNWQQSSGTTVTNITTSGGTTNLNFINTGTINTSGLSTTAGITNINIYNGKTATISGAIATSGTGATNVLFKGAEGVTTRADEYSTLVLGNASNQITSVRSSAEKAKILLDGTKNATIGTTTIDTGASLVFAFTGDNTSTVTATKGITVGNGATLGISLSGSGNKEVLAGAGANITFAKGSTLLIDFQAGNSATGIIGDGTPFTISEGSNSIVNFWGANTGSLNASGNNSVTIDGGNNTVNFYGSATLGGIAFGTKGGTNTINVVDDDNGIIGTVAVADISKSAVTNIINLGKNATLELTSANTTLTSSSTGNELNFIGDSATFRGGFGVSGSGKATINVGMISANPTDTIPPVSGKITGAVTGADLKFNAGESTLTLQGQTNTFTSLTSGASDGILYLDASTSNVSAEIGSSFAIGSGKSLTFALVSGGNNSTPTTTGGEASVSVNGAITVGTGGTLGIAIGGDNKNGQRSVTASGGITFQGGSTLRVDFLANSAGTASLGTGKDGFVITGGNKSVINFYAGSSATLDGGLTIDGGDNTVNFQGSAQLRDIKLVRGTNTINVLGASAEGSRITATLISKNLGGNKFSNTVNLEKFAVLNLKADDSSEDGSGSIKTLVNVNDESTVIQGNLLDGSSIAFTKKAGGLTLKGARNSGVTNALTTISTVDGASNTLALDTSNGNNTTTVSGNVNASGLSVNLAGTGASNKATLALNGGSLGAINVANTANALALNGRETSINTFALASNAVLNIEFNGGGLNAVNGIAKDTDKTFNLSANRGNSFVGGGNIDANTLSFENNASLAIRSAEASFATVSKNGTLVLDGANGTAPSVKVTLTDVTGNLTAKFNGSEAKGTELVMSKTGQTLDAIAFGTNSTNNKLTLTAGTTTITDKVKVGNNNAITFSLADGTTLNLAGGMTSSGTSTISSANDASVTLAGGGADATKAINLTNLDLRGGTTAQLTVKNAKADISNFNAKTLILDGSTGAVDTTLHIFNDGLNVEMKGEASKVATLNLNGGAIASVSATSGDATQNIINFKSGTTTIGTISGNDAGMALNLKGGNLILSQEITADGSAVTRANHISVDVSIDRGSALSLAGENNAIHSLSGNGVVDLAMADSNGNPLTRSVRARAFKTLTIADYKNGNNTFNIYVNPRNPDSNGYKADQVNITDTNSSGVATFTVTGNIDDILGITYNSQKPDDPNNVKVGNIKGNATVAGGDSLIGYDIIQAQVFKADDGSGNVYLGQAISKGVAQEIKDVASSALTVNYDLFLANFNSLNKRMGELRDNANSQGVWTRVFGGAMSNDFGAGSKSEYVTAQAGYDYSLTLGDARNYMGIAVAYGHSTTKSNTLDIQVSQGATIALQDVKSNMVEVGIYNSYVMDSGWYNDTIFKFDYIMSSFTMTDNLSLESETNNFAMVLSDEFGYRYKFAENEKGNWYIDPQVEVAFGYFNQSDFNRAMLATNSTLEASQDNILTLRTRAGMSLGKKFNTTKGFASVYVGAFYEYDYINGGDAEVLSKSGIANPLDKLESNGRAIVNIGSNIELTEGVRMYIDVEKSFGDKQRTDMQFNFGARYNFGEKVPTPSYLEAQKKRVAPLKVEEKQESIQERKAEALANTQEQKAQDNTEAKQ